MVATTSALEKRLLKRAQISPSLWGGRGDASECCDVFGLRFLNIPMAAAAADLVISAREGRSVRAVFVNAHVVNEMAANRAYADVVASADRLLADGSGMAIAAKLNGTPFIDNLNGTDLFPLLCAAAIEAGVTIFMLGGAEGVAAQAHANLVRFGLGAAIAGTHHGYFQPGSPEEAHAVAVANASGASILLVGMGVPRQDLWVARHARHLKAPVLAGVGGLFDFFSGRIERAPQVLRSFGLEWTWRLALEPRRMWRRYVVGNVMFLMRAVMHAYNITPVSFAATKDA